MAENDKKERERQNALFLCRFLLFCAFNCLDRFAESCHHTFCTSYTDHVSTYRFPYKWGIKWNKTTSA